MSSAPGSYEAVHAWDRVPVHVDRRGREVECVLQVRDVEILRALWAHHFLTTHHVAGLWWSTDGPRAIQRRLAKLFEAGYVDRFRPRIVRGSFPWTYALTRAGFAAARDYRAIPDSARYSPRPIHNFHYVLHDLQLNAWVVAYRRAVGGTLRRWLGEEEAAVAPPEGLKPARIEIEDGLTIEGLRQPKPQLVRPDSVLELELQNEQGFGSFFLEFDRTRRPDKARRKLARYDAFISWWWRRTEACGFQLDAPYAVFICQDEAHLRSFLAAADVELTGHEWGTRLAPDAFVYPARERILFVDEHDLHAGRLEAWRVPTFPPGHPAREGPEAAPHRVQLPERMERSELAA